MPLCSWIDPPSIELGEYLPFWRDLEFNDVIDEQANSCNDISDNKRVPGASLLCNFSVTNGSGRIWQVRDVPCLEDAWRETN